ncbi:MAG: hypothetical protein ACFCD0_26485 [Gemmataceae bacterium]
MKSRSRLTALFTLFLSVQLGWSQEIVVPSTILEVNNSGETKKTNQIVSQHQSHKPTKAAPMPPGMTVPTTGGTEYASSLMLAPESCSTCSPRQRRLFESDRAFPNFIGPITNPILAKDPRSLTEARFFFVQNYIPEDHPFEGGDFQAYALQLRLALTERLTLIADRDGIATITPGSTGIEETGLLNIGVGLRYLFVRDVERQLLVSGGLMFSPQTGSGNVFQSHGDGTFTVFGTVAKEFGTFNHVIVNAGYQFPVDSEDNSSFFYTSLHVDRQLFGWIYPMAELNWYHYSGSGDRGIPSSVGEGDGLLNIGTSEVAGNDLVTLGFGVSFLFNHHLQAGIAYEFPISNREDLLDDRILVEAIFRY